MHSALYIYHLIYILPPTEAFARGPVRKTRAGVNTWTTNFQVSQTEGVVRSVIRKQQSDPSQTERDEALTGAIVGDQLAADHRDDVTQIPFAAGMQTFREPNRKPIDE
ncbi:hypothetical protein CHELA20_11482 [Hyphomicrobiales bacterium]|nr:hypothetical protein CHELA20_11482 [Hyphomicrobiales bacterium]CAH1695902.1 hypothetical protein CHELA41_51728 [Hyphomicrobiales bacterium]